MTFDLTRFEKETYCYLTTRGRVTGKPHEIEIWFVVYEGAIYIMSGGGTTSDWVKNLLKEPSVALRIAGQTFSAHASVDTTSEEALLRNIMADKYKERETNGSLSEWAQTALVVKFISNDSQK